MEEVNPPKVHRHLLESVATTLIEIFRDGRPADKAIEKQMKTNRKWGARDRRFFAENVYDCVRWWRLLWELRGTDVELTIPALTEIWEILQALPDNKEVQHLPVSVQQSIPEWLDEVGRTQMKEQWKSILKSLNQKSKVDLRTNTLKTTREDLQKSLFADGVNTNLVENSTTAITLPERKNVFITPSFKNGLFEVQDRASQMIAPFMELAPGQRVIDACAGAGGKSLHIAALMKNKGRVLALDIHEWKLNELKQRARRNGIDIIETRVIDSTKVIKRLEDGCDRLLLDVPCSGLGVLRRNPDTKWKLSLDELGRLNELQAQILHSYTKMVKKGGLCIYATCSFLPSENEEQISKFLTNCNKDGGKVWELVEQIRINPDQGMGDGFFAAKLKRI